MLTFRPATAADVALLRSLAGRIWRAYYPPIIGAEQVEYMLGWMYSAETIQREIAEGTVWIIAEHEGEPAGFISITREAGSIAKMKKLYLTPELHGKRLGQLMIEHACSIARELGVDEMRLQVNKQNARAIRAYERAGFKTIEEGVFDIGGGYVMDDYIMAKPLDAT